MADLQEKKQKLKIIPAGSEDLRYDEQLKYSRDWQRYMHAISSSHCHIVCPCLLPYPGKITFTGRRRYQQII